MTILEKLSNIQQALKAPKNQFNNFGKYSYRNAEDILEAVKPLCKDANTVVTLSDDIRMIGERYYIVATVTLHDLESGEKFSVSANAREEETKKGMDGSQVTGAASSYARKYALNGLFCIDDEKDSDFTNQQTNNRKQKEGGGNAAGATPQQAAAATPKCEMCGKDIMPVLFGSGKIFSVDDILASSQKVFRKKLCYKCLKQSGEAQKADMAKEAAARYEQDAMNMDYEPYPVQEEMDERTYKAYR